MNKANRCVNSVVKLSLLFSLVMAAIGLCAAPDSGTLIVDGEVVHYGYWDPVKQQYKWPLTHRYACGAVGTYSYTSEAKVGVFKLEFTGDTTIQGECYPRTAPPTGESYAICTSSSSLEVYLNGHTVHVLPSGATTDVTRASWQSKIYSGESLKIYGGASGSTGAGTLDVHQGYIRSYNDLGIYGAIVNITEGGDKTEVTAIESGITGRLTVSDSHISISGYSKLIQPQHGFTCTGSMLDLVSRKSAHGDSVSDTAVIEDGNYQVGGHGISLLGSVVSIVSEHPGLSGIRPRGELLVENSCVAIVSDRSCVRHDGYSSSSTGCQTFRNARMIAISTTGNALAGAESDSEKSMAKFCSGEYVFGSSGNKQGGNLMDDPEYYLNPEGKIAALVSGRIEIDGGNLEICAPNAYGCDTCVFTMKDGSLKMIDSIDHGKSVHAILDETAVKETVSANVQFAGWTAEHSQMLKNMLDHLDAANVGTFEGRAAGVVETERFFQSGGRIDPGTALYGGYIKSYNAGWDWAAPVVTGGSLKMNFRYLYETYKEDEYRAITPINELGQRLMRVDYDPYWVSVPPLSGAGSFGFPTMAQLSGGPYSAWSKPLVLRSTKPYDVEYVAISAFEPGDSPYAQWLIANFGSSPITFPSMMIEILSSDGRTLYWDSIYQSQELGAGVAASINYKWERFKELAEGCYSLRVTLDPHGQMQDSYRGDNVVTFPFTVATSDTTLHAVTYNPGAYGVGSEQTAMKQDGMALILGGVIFTRSGYRQTGWSLTDGGAKVYDLNGAYTTDAEIVLYPYWSANSTEPAETFAEALGVPELECEPWGNTDEWQLRIDHDWMCDGNGSATVGNKVMEGTASPGFSFKVTGPTQMKFSYSKSFSSGAFYVGCTAGELYRDDTPGEKTDWKQVVLDIPAGEQTVYFRVLLFFSDEYDYNGFWIDDLQLGDFEHDRPDSTECHTVTFDLGKYGVRTGGGELSQTVMDGEAATPPEFAVVDGWTFAGWNTSFDHVTSDLTVTAQWKRNRTDGIAEFETSSVTAEEGGAATIEVWGGRSDRASRVQVFLVGLTATPADLELSKATINGAMPKGGLKSPLTLSWAAGDTKPKTISIPVKIDKSVEGNEFFLLQLGGAEGQEIGKVRTCMVAVEDETVDVSLAQAANAPTLKVTTKGDGKWLAAKGNDYYFPDEDRGMYHVQSPALPPGKSATIEFSGVRGRGQFQVFYRFVGPYEGGAPATLRILANKMPLEPDTILSHAEHGEEIRYFTVNDYSDGAGVYSYVFTQGDNPDVRVEIVSAQWTSASGLNPVMICVNSQGSGYGAVTGAGAYQIGETVKIVAKPAAGRTFAGWYRWSSAAGRYEPYDATHASLTIKVSEPMDLLAVFVGIPYVFGFADHAERGKVTGNGFCDEGKRVTLKAAANKGYVFTGWCHEDGTFVAKTPTLVIDRSASPKKDSASSTTITEIMDTISYVAKFVTSAEDAASIAANVNGFAFGAGTAEPDETVVTKFATNVMCGVYLEWPVAASALSETTVKVAGLPSGLKFTAKPITSKVTSGTVASRVTTVVTNVPANTIYGAPTAASKTAKDKTTGLMTVKPSVVKVTVTTAGKNKQTYQIDTTVDPLPAWAVGTFAGPSYDGGRGTTALPGDAVVTNGAATVTIAASGKITAKQPVDGKSTSFTANYFDAYDGDSFRATLTAKSGKIVLTNEMAVCGHTGRVTLPGGGEQIVTNGVIEADRFDAWQCNWKVEPWKTIGKTFDKREVSYEEDGVWVTLKFSAAGTAKVAGEFATYDKDGNVVMKNGKPVTVMASGSATLLPVFGEDGEMRYLVFVYLAPKGLAPHARCLEVP